MTKPKWDALYTDDYRRQYKESDIDSIFHYTDNVMDFCWSAIDDVILDSLIIDENQCTLKFLLQRVEQTFVDFCDIDRDNPKGAITSEDHIGYRSFWLLSDKFYEWYNRDTILHGIKFVGYKFEPVKRLDKKERTDAWWGHIKEYLPDHRYLHAQ